MNYKPFWYTLALFTGLSICKTRLFAQGDSVLAVHKINTLTGNIAGFSVDNLGNIYIINQNNQIKKYNEKGDSIAVYNDVKRYGNIYSVDASNPLKVLVFYKDFLTIVVLDRLLAVRNTIDLRKQNIYQAQAVATSYDGNFWVYDEQSAKIKKIDDQGKSIFESTDLRMALPDPPQPISIFDRDGQLYLYDTAKGVFVFDYYGAVRNTLAITHIKDLQVIDRNTITGRIGNSIVVYKPSTLQMFTYKLGSDASGFNSARFYTNRLYALTSKQQVEIYRTP